MWKNGGNLRETRETGSTGGVKKFREFSTAHFSQANFTHGYTNIPQLGVEKYKRGG